jgi:hypothetical protein
MSTGPRRYLQVAVIALAALLAGGFWWGVGRLMRARDPVVGG